MVVVEEGLRRITLPLPFGLDHVHCYFVRLSSGGWLLVDTGLGTPRARGAVAAGARRARCSGRADPRHAHASRPRRRGARRGPAHGRAGPAGPRGFRAVRRAPGGRTGIRSASRDTGATNGVPADALEDVVGATSSLVAAVHYAPAPELLDAGDDVDGWDVEVLRGHADGHIVLHPRRRADRRRHDPGADLARRRPLPELAPRSARRLPGDARAHRGARAAGRVRRPRPEHRRPGRAGATSCASTTASESTSPRRRSRPSPVNAWQVSFELFPADLGGGQRRFAVAETLAHLERLVFEGRAARADDGGYTLAAREAGLVSRLDTMGSCSRFGSAFSPCRATFASTSQMLRRLGAEVTEVRKAEQFGDARRAGDSGRRVDDLHPADAPLRARRCGQGLRSADLRDLRRDDRPRPQPPRARRPVGAAQRVRPPGRVVRDRPRRRGRERADARGLHPGAVGRGRRARASRCSPRSTAGRCSRARGGSSSRRSIRS